ncbi:3-dehydroquinate synthase [Oscillospiraceae bacterium OttesenSCG-928-G22]|nr:3-dehydroquinate synthase [Oscillospiraceae bacterium OttesenSCG-928-G22]
MEELLVSAPNGATRVVLCDDLSRLAPEVRDALSGGVIAAVADETLDMHITESVADSLRALGFRTDIYRLPSGEQAKDERTLFELLGFFGALGLSREDGVLAIGGGASGDVAGFAASIYLRGVPLVLVPTTVLAAVDSSIGGKNGINCGGLKNQVGTFYPPKLVYTSPVFWETLDGRARNSGFAEIVKYGAIRDAALFSRLEADGGMPAGREGALRVISRCVEIKRDYVERDPFDRGVRAELNFGHTVGHAVEAASGGRMTHGEAVSVGMAFAADFGEHLGITEPGTGERLRRLLLACGLPARYPGAEEAPIRRALSADKKRKGEHVTYIFLKRIGEAVARPVAIADILSFWGAWHGRD